MQCLCKKCQKANNIAYVSGSDNWECKHEIKVYLTYEEHEWLRQVCLSALQAAKIYGDMMIYHGGNINLDIPKARELLAKLEGK